LAIQEEKLVLGTGIYRTFRSGGRLVHSGITAIGHHFHDIFISLNNHGVSRIFSGNHVLRDRFREIFARPVLVSAAALALVPPYVLRKFT
jgi:hypothetical protein